MKFLAVVTVAALLFGAVVIAILPTIGVTGVALLMGVPFRLDWHWTLISACGIFILWFILSTKSDTAIRAALHRKPRVHQEIATNLLSLALLALGYSLITESFWAACLMAAIVCCIYMALRPVIEKAEAASRRR
ncbi:MULTISPECIES: hypothetical protein [Brachybacterium]|uniref:Uncharacterized protein n=1 Tax=Brachybacterium paraconglomeratum TaxID=173362 RepID=A0A3R8QPN3_9MICO|nr:MULTISPECIES: hypothetical protein [Brachybacterium]MCT1437239.1 hypothetical protein [Brachybacterium paraconglomeratum]RRR19215.1 hypothetical protein DS079_06125 [Brachybacterium paraconglomeratum]